MAGWIWGFSLPKMNDPKTKDMPYREQIKQPEWKEFALKLKKEADWTCEMCSRREGTHGVVMTVHHTFYLTGMKAWEHPRGLLMCLCWECHEKRQAVEQNLHLNVALAMRDKSIEELAKQPIYGFFDDGFTVTGNGGAN